MVHKCFTEFHCRCTTINDTERPGRPIEIPTVGIVNKINDIVLADCQVRYRSLRFIAERITGAYYAAVFNQFNSELMKKQTYLAKKNILFHTDKL